MVFEEVIDSQRSIAVRLIYYLSKKIKTLYL